MNEDQLNKEWESFQRRHDPSKSKDAKWDSTRRKLKIIPPAEALKIVQENTKIIKEGVGEENLIQLLKYCKFKVKRNSKRFMRCKINVSMRPITEEKPVMKQTGFPITVPPTKPGALPAGLEIAVGEMKPEETRSVILPPELAFGEQKMPNIPPWSTVDFEIELINFSCHRL